MINMRTSPIRSLPSLIRIVVKAVILVAILNFVFLVVGFDPIQALVRINLWGLAGRGRERVIYASDFQNGQLPIPALLATHELAVRPKAADEYRVIVLGDSAVMGWGLQDVETFAAQLTARGLYRDGKRLVAYNLAYPTPSIARDTLLIEAAQRYQPDAAIWFVTATGFAELPHDDLTRGVLQINRSQLSRITDANGLADWYDRWVMPEAPVTRWSAFRDPVLTGVWIGTLPYPFIVPDVGKAERRAALAPIPIKARFTSDHPVFVGMPGDTWRFLEIGKQVADSHGMQLFIVNEPILIQIGANSETNYNTLYERALYDRYRVELAVRTQVLGIPLIDLWDAIPAANFTDTVLHMDADGYRQVVDRVIEVLSE